MSSKIVLPLILLFVIFFTSIPLYGWPMEGGEEKGSDPFASAEGKEKLRVSTAPNGMDENASAGVARGDGSRLPEEPAVQQGEEQPLDFSKMRNMQFIDRATMEKWARAEVEGDMNAQKEILDTAMKSMISKIPSGARMNSADIRKKLTSELKLRTIQAGGTAKVISSSAVGAVVQPREIRPSTVRGASGAPPTAGVNYTQRRLIVSPSALGGAQQISAAIIPAIAAHNAKGVQEEAGRSALLKKAASSVSDTDYGELENEFPNTLFDHGGLGLVITVEENESVSDSKKMPAKPSLVRSPDRRLIVSHSALDEGISKGPPVSGVRYTIRNITSPSLIDVEQQMSASVPPAIIAHDAKGVQEGTGKPALKKAASSADYGEFENEELDEERKDVLLELQETIHAEELHVVEPPVLRITFLKDQRAPSQRDLANEASSRTLAREASCRDGAEEANIKEDHLSATVREELPLVESAAEPFVVGPPAALYTKLSREEKSRLDEGRVVVTETKGESYKSYGITYYKPSTFTAYYLLEADERGAAALYWDPSQATKILPRCADVQVTKMLSPHTTANYIFQVDADVPLLGRQVFQEAVSMKSERLSVEGDGEKISFEKTGDATYVETFKGAFTVVPHEDKLLAAYEVTAEFKGIAGKLITNNAIRNIVYGTLWNIIQLVRTPETSTASEGAF
ncbi:MAG: hypothetical protein NT164_07650 [Verrucomicrobiae bacterium]|nr:hypothetical protein [Verrucomicrobiae bacterium]